MKTKSKTKNVEPLTLNLQPLIFNFLLLTKKKVHHLGIFFLLLFAISCTETNRTLPILGERDVVNGDTVYHAIPDFKFVNQDSVEITQADFKDKIYVADFFFTSCPTICPLMKTQMLRVYEKFKDSPSVGILSHTIDPRHDSVSVLKSYRKRLGVSGTTWQFVTGKQSDIYEIGEKSYMVTAQEDPTDAKNGGFIHSGAFILVDKNRNIRGVYDGTKEKEVSQLLVDMELLLSSDKK